MIYNGEGEEMLLDSREVHPRILGLYMILLDGEPHRPGELRTTLNIRGNYLNQKLVALRKVLRPRGFDILVRYIDKIMHYQMIRLISRPSDPRQ